MANWTEFEGKWTWTMQDGGLQKRVLQTTPTRQLEDGDEVTLYEKRGGFLRKKLDSRILVQVLDDKTALLKIQRPYESIVNAGMVQNPNGVGGFGYATERFETVRDHEGRIIRDIVEGVKTVTQQDVWVDIGKDRIRGVMWTRDGVRVQPEIITNGRSYYADDADEEAQTVLNEAYKKRRMLAEGKIRFEEIASIGGISVGLTFEVPDESPLNSSNPSNSYP